MVVGVDRSKRQVIAWVVAMPVFFGFVGFLSLRVGTVGTVVLCVAAALGIIVNLRFLLFAAYFVEYEDGVLRCKAVWNGEITIPAEDVISISVIVNDEGGRAAYIRYAGGELRIFDIRNQFPDFCRYVAAKHRKIALIGDPASYFEGPRLAAAKAHSPDPDCPVCKGVGLVCENHRGLSWPEDCECGDAVPCPACSIAQPNTPYDFVLDRAPDAALRAALKDLSLKRDRQ